MHLTHARPGAFSLRACCNDEAVLVEWILGLVGPGELHDVGAFLPRPEVGSRDRTHHEANPVSGLRHPGGVHGRDADLVAAKRFGCLVLALLTWPQPILRSGIPPAIDLGEYPDVALDGCATGGIAGANREHVGREGP